MFQGFFKTSFSLGILFLLSACGSGPAGTTGANNFQQGLERNSQNSIAGEWQLVEFAGDEMAGPGVNIFILSDGNFHGGCSGAILAAPVQGSQAIQLADRSGDCFVDFSIEEEERNELLYILQSPTEYEIIDGELYIADAVFARSN